MTDGQTDGRTDRRTDRRTDKMITIELRRPRLGAIKRNKSADVDIVLKEYFIECHDILL